MLVSNLALATLAIVTARLLGPSERGILVLVVTVTAFSMLVTSLGTPFSARRILGRKLPRADMEGIFGLFGCLVALQGASALTILPILLRLARVYLSPTALVVAALYAIAVALAMYARETLYGMGLSKQAAGLEAVGSVAQLALVATVLMWSTEVTAQMALLAMGLGNLVQFTLQAASVYRSAGFVRPRYRPGIWIQLLRTGTAGIGFSAGQMVAVRADRYLLAIFSSTATVGVYSVAATAADYLWLAPFAVSQVLFHSVASGRVNLRTVRRMHRVVLTLSLVLVMVIYLLTPYIISLLFGHAYIGAATPMRVIIFGSIGFGSFQVTASALAASGHLRRAAVSATVGGILLVAGSFLLIPPYGALGAAYASVAAYWCMAGLSYRYMVIADERSPSGGFG